MNEYLYLAHKNLHTKPCVFTVRDKERKKEREGEKLIT